MQKIANQGASFAKELMQPQLGNAHMAGQFMVLQQALALNKAQSNANSG